MSCGVSIQYAKLLSDILEDTSPSLSDDDKSEFNISPKSLNPSSKSLLLNDAEESGDEPSLQPLSLYDPDTESDDREFCDTSSPSSLTSVGNSDEEEDLLLKGSVDERTCARLLQNKINAVLDRATLGNAAESVLDRCASLPLDLKSNLLWRSISRKCVTDDMLHCFLTKRIQSETDPSSCSSLTEIDRPSEFALQLRQLSLCECKKITDSGLKTISRCCPSLQSLDLTRCRSITALGLQELIRSCTFLTDLCLCECPALCDKTVPTVFRYNNPSHIRCLSIRRCDIHDYGLSTLASYCPTLQKLDIRCCGLITAAGFNALIQRVPSINVLSCGRCIGTDDLALKYIGQGFGTTLVDLNLAMCWRVSSRGVAELVRNCRQLRSLNLNSCTNVDDSALKAISRNPYLQRSLVGVSLNECNVGDDALEELVANCSSLSFISVVGCPRVTYARAVRLAQLAGIQIMM